MNKSSIDVNDLIHDINSSLTSLKSAMEIIEQSWREDYALVDKIIPLANDKLQSLHELLKNYNRASTKE